MRAFTLIEALVTLALISLLLTGALVSTYAIASSTEHNRQKAYVETEGRFVIDLFAWHIRTGDIVEPAASGESGRLIIRTRDGTLLDTDDESPLTDLYVRDLLFRRSGNVADPADPERIDMSLTLDTGSPGQNQTFRRTVYLRAP